MSNDKVVVDAVTKVFRMHQESRGSLKERFVRGKPKGISTFKALDNVSFNVAKGQTIGLIGHNGSGKSTLLKLLAGVYRPTSGTVQVDGRVSALLELGAGFHGDLTGRENIRLNGAILGYTRRQIDYSIDKIIDFADIGEFIDAPVKVYSSGMYVRLGFAVAVMLDPEILIVDEIIAVGDEEFQRKCFDHLFYLRRKGVTIALVTHSMGLARELCDDAVWLDHGKLRELGPVDRIVEDYLAEVNADEAAKRAHEIEVDKLIDVVVISESALEEQSWEGHRGSGEARISEIVPVDKDGATIGFATVGSELNLRMEIIADEFVPQADVTLEVFSESGLLLSSFASARSGQPNDIQIGTSTIDIVIPRFSLAPGKYVVAGTIAQKGHVVDRSDAIGNLTVRTADGQGGNGLFVMPAEWGRMRKSAIDE